MKKKLLFAATLLAALTLSSCHQKELEAAQHSLDSLKNEKDMLAKQFDEQNQLISEIQDNFTQINEAEQLVTEDASSTEGVNQDKKAQMQQNFKLIQDKFEENKNKIAELEQQVAESKGKMSSLQGMISKLKKQQAIHEKQIADLQEQLKQKDIEIEDIKKDRDNQVAAMTAAKNTSDSINAAKIKAQDIAMHTVYYLIDNKKNLKAKGLKAGLKKAEVKESYCTKVDYREFSANEGMTFKKQPVLYTIHPLSSYSITKNADKTYTFTIKDPERFWSNKFMVMQNNDK